MSKRSQSIDNLTKQKEDIELKIIKLNISLTGINKSLLKLKTEEEKI